MPLDTIRVFESRSAAKYTGSNSADLNAAISDFTIVAENAQGLTFTSGGQQYAVAPNGYISWYQGEVTHVFQNQSDFESVFASEQALEGHVHDLVLTTGPAKAPEPEENAV